MSSTRCGELVHVTRASRPGSLLGAPRRWWRLRHRRDGSSWLSSLAPAIYGGQLLWPVEHASAVLKRLPRPRPGRAGELTLWAHVCHFPPLPDLPEPIRGRSFVDVAATYLGSAADGRGPAVVAARRRAGRAGPVGPVPPSGLGAVAAEPTEPDAGARALDAAHRPRRRGDRRASCAVVGDPADLPARWSPRSAASAGRFADGPRRPPAPSAPVDEPFQLFALGVPAVPELAAAIPHGFAALDGRVGRLATGPPHAQLHPGGAPARRLGYAAARLERLRRDQARSRPAGHDPQQQAGVGRLTRT